MKQSELESFKELLIERKKQVLQNINSVNQEIKNIDITNAKDEADFATLNTNTMIDQALNLQQSNELFEIEYALSKMTKNTYGICEMCEEYINMQRLRIKPYAKYCIVCRKIAEKETAKKRSF